MRTRHRHEFNLGEGCECVGGAFDVGPERHHRVRIGQCAQRRRHVGDVGKAHGVHVEIAVGALVHEVDNKHAQRQVTRVVSLRNTVHNVLRAIPQPALPEARSMGWQQRCVPGVNKIPKKQSREH